jgi:hypothetical protein
MSAGNGCHRVDHAARKSAKAEGRLTNCWNVDAPQWIFFVQSWWGQWFASPDWPKEVISLTLCAVSVVVLIRILFSWNEDKPLQVVCSHRGLIYLLPNVLILWYVCPRIIRNNDDLHIGKIFNFSPIGRLIEAWIPSRCLVELVLILTDAILKVHHASHIQAIVMLRYGKYDHRGANEKERTCPYKPRKQKLGCH